MSNLLASYLPLPTIYSLVAQFWSHPPEQNVTLAAKCSTLFSGLMLGRKQEGSGVFKSTNMALGEL